MSRKQKWPYIDYGWLVISVTLVQVAVGTAISYVAFNTYDLGYGLSLLAGSVVGVAIGVAYKLLAKANRWERLHWIDVILMGISLYP